MLRVANRDLNKLAQRLLDNHQAQVDSKETFEDRVREAEDQFSKRSRNWAFDEVRKTLAAMTGETKRCMYCEDSAATDVEHFRPKRFYPEAAFRWENFLYACSGCNRTKGSEFAVFGKRGRLIEIIHRRGDPIVPPPDGDGVPINPRSDDGMEFLMLDILGGTFLFVPIGPKGSHDFVRGRYTIELLGLNTRDYLPAARREAYFSYRDRLEAYASKQRHQAGSAEMDGLPDALRRMQHPTVWREMIRQREWIPELNRLFAKVPAALTW